MKKLLISRDAVTRMQAIAVVVVVIMVAIIGVAWYSNILPGIFTSNDAYSSGVLDFVPQGIAEVELNDGRKFSVPANCFVYVDTNIIQGLYNDYSEIVLFENMELFELENDSIIAAMLDGSSIALTKIVLLE